MFKYYIILLHSLVNCSTIIKLSFLSSASINSTIRRVFKQIRYLKITFLIQKFNFHPDHKIERFSAFLGLLWAPHSVFFNNLIINFNFKDGAFKGIVGPMMKQITQINNHTAVWRVNIYPMILRVQSPQAILPKPRFLEQ